jgi:predicted lipoprotein with Yx(FWY)xxD motif
MTRTTRPLLALTLGAAMVLLAACGSSGSSKTGSGATTTSSAAPTTTTSSAAATTTTTAGSATAVVSVSTTSLGPTLVDSSGHTLYEYQPDPMGSSTCTGGCATVWPPLTAPGTTVAVGAGLTASLFTVVSGAGGTHVVAVAGHALYRFSGDTKAGDTKGQGFAGIWHAAGPSGAPIT